MENSTSGFSDNVHFRAPADFLPQVHLVARTHGMTAASFMRNAIIEAMQRLHETNRNPG